MRYSIIIPLHNEKNCILRLYSELKKAIDPLGELYELIFINDASTDGSREILEEIRSKDDKVRLVSFIKRKGQGWAFREGFDSAEGEIVVTMDGDLQDDPKDIPRLMGKVENGYDVVCGWRKDRQDPFLTKSFSKIANKIRRMILHEKIHDVNCSLRAYKAGVLRRITFSGSMYYMLTAILAESGCKISELEVRHHPREFGKSKFNFWRRIALFNALLMLRFLYNRDKYRKIRLTYFCR